MKNTETQPQAPLVLAAALVCAIPILAAVILLLAGRKADSQTLKTPPAKVEVTRLGNPKVVADLASAQKHLGKTGQVTAFTYAGHEYQIGRAHV